MERKEDSVKVRIIRKKSIKEAYFLLAEELCDASGNTIGLIKADDLIRVVSRENGMYGFIDKNGREVIPCKYRGTLDFSEGLAAVHNGSQWGFIDKQGKEVIPCKYKDVKPFSEGLAAVYDGWRWGFIDNNGKKIISFRYEDVEPFSEGLAAVSYGPEFCLSYRKRWGFIDKEGKEVKSPDTYFEVNSFSEGLAAVYNGFVWDFIDKEGKTEFFDYDYRCTRSCSFKDGKALVGKKELFSDDIWRVSYFFIDKTGKRITGELSKLDPTIINPALMIADKEVIEELYISDEKEIPDNCLSIEILGFKSKAILDDGEELYIECDTREELEKEIEKASKHQLNTLENSIKNFHPVRILKPSNQTDSEVK